MWTQQRSFEQEYTYNRTFILCIRKCVDIKKHTFQKYLHAHVCQILFYIQTRMQPYRLPPKSADLNNVCEMNTVQKFAATFCEQYPV